MQAHAAAPLAEWAPQATRRLGEALQGAGQAPALRQTEEDRGEQASGRQERDDQPAPAVGLDDTQGDPSTMTAASAMSAVEPSSRRRTR